MATAKAIAVGALVWLILTSGAALWIGSMFASWFDGGNDTEMGLLIASGQTHFMFAIPQAGATLSG